MLFIIVLHNSGCGNALFNDCPAASGNEEYKQMKQYWRVVLDIDDTSVTLQFCSISYHKILCRYTHMKQIIVLPSTNTCNVTNMRDKDSQLQSFHAEQYNSCS